eukprot:5705297-Alexandrium_andersonii.AAC.1
MALGASSAAAGPPGPAAAPPAPAPQRQRSSPWASSRRPGRCPPPHARSCASRPASAAAAGPGW